MTAVPSSPQTETAYSTDNVTIEADIHPLESLFYLGYATSPVVTIFKDDSATLQAQFRTLTPVELRDVLETANRFTSDGAKVITERIETLARAIVHINHMPLMLVNKDQQEFFNKYKRNPSPLDMARVILQDKIKSMVVIDALYDYYMEFVSKLLDKFEEAKKKLNPESSTN
jgi:hypothetical protein